MSSLHSPSWTLCRRAGRQLAFQFVYERSLNPRPAPRQAAAGAEQAEAGASLEEMERFARRVEAPWDDQPEADEPALSAMLRDPSARHEILAFASRLAAGVLARREELDRCIAQAAHHWSLERMAPVDRAILRVGAFELLFGDAPPRVAINEAVELAKRFGGADSGSFVNGILDRLMHEKQGEAAAE